MNNKNILLVIGVVVLILLAVVSVKYSGNGQVGGALRGSDKSGSSVTLGKTGSGSINPNNPSNPSLLPPPASCPPVTGLDICVLDLKWKTAPTLDASTFGNGAISSATSSLIQNTIYFRMSLINSGTQVTEIPIGTIFKLYVDVPDPFHHVGTFRVGFDNGEFQGECKPTGPYDCSPNGPGVYQYKYTLNSIWLPPYTNTNDIQTIDFVSSKPGPVPNDADTLISPAQFVSLFGIGSHTFILQADEIQATDNCMFVTTGIYNLSWGCVNEGIYTSTGLSQEPTNNFFQIPFTII